MPKPITEGVGTAVANGLDGAELTSVQTWDSLGFTGTWWDAQPKPDLGDFYGAEGAPFVSSSALLEIDLDLSGLLPPSSDDGTPLASEGGKDDDSDPRMKPDPVEEPEDDEESGDPGDPDDGGVPPDGDEGDGDDEGDGNYGDGSTTEIDDVTPQQAILALDDLLTLCEAATAM